MHSIRTKFTALTVSVLILALGIATVIGVITIGNLGRDDADQMIHLTATTGAMNLESYFNSVERTVETVAAMVKDSLEETESVDLEGQVERSRHLFAGIANNTSGVLTYYFRIDPEVSETVKGFWYVKRSDGKGFEEHEVTDINQYDTNDTSSLVWFTVPKAGGKEGVWLPPYYTENLGARVISYNVPVYRNDQFIGVVGIEIEYETLAKEAEKIKIFESGYSFILDEDHNVIYHPQMDSVKLDLETTAINETDRYIGSNHIQYRFEGVEKEAVWIPLSNGMRLYVAAPVSEINRGFEALIRNMIIASLLILAGTVFLTMRFAGSITKPLSDLTEAARRAEQGDYEFELSYDGDDEVGILTNTFRHLASHTKEHISSLSRRVYVDALTSVRNKAGYSEAMQEIQDQIDAKTEDVAFAIGVFDCDNLKSINDTYGHDKGDLYLKSASQLICRIFQHSPVFRIGGDEFAVILKNEDYRNRKELLAQFRETREKICEAAENPWDQVNVTMGLAVYDPKTDPAVIDVARRADRSMYENKRIRKGIAGTEWKEDF